VGEKCSDKFRLRIRLPRNSRDLLCAANIRHGTDGFTSPPKEGVLRIFVYEITWKKYSSARKPTDDNMAHAYCMLDN